MTVLESSAAPAQDGVVRARRPPRPWGLLAISVAVIAVLAAPLVFLLVEAHGAGVSTVEHLVFRGMTASLLWNTVRLTVVVTALCAIIGTAAAWCIERTDLPGRRIWAVLVVIPLAIPDFVVSFGWASLSTWVQGFRGAVLVMTLAVYPLVYLPVAASFRNADPGQEEVARSLGVGRLATFWRVTLGQARRAILGGCLLVALVMLAEYGAFEILGYQTFTTEIFTEFNVSFSISSACALSIVLVLVSLLVLGGESLARGRGRASRSGPLAQRVAARHRLGRAKLPVLAGFAVLVALALGVPVGSSIYWIVNGRSASLTGMPLLDAAWHTALYGGAAAALATVMALLIGYPLSDAAFGQPFSNYYFWATVGTLVIIIVYVMLCVGGIVFFYRTRDTRRWNPLVHVLVPLVGAVVFGAALYGSIYPAPPGILKWTPYVAGVWLVIGIAALVWLRTRRPGSVDQIGSILGEEGGTDAAVLDA